MLKHTYTKGKFGQSILGLLAGYAAIFAILAIILALCGAG